MIVTADSLCFRHNGAEGNTLQDLTFSITEGALYCLGGINGSGKSTLLGVLAGLFSPSAGILQVAGLDLPRQAYALRQHIALVPQDPDVYILGSIVREDLFLALDPDNTAAQEKALRIATSFGLGDLLEAPVNILSYGQKRKLCLASALAAQPKLLLLDEPFAGLDYPSALAMTEILTANKAAGISQIVVSHDLELMAEILDGFLLLKGGRLIYSGEVTTALPYLAEAQVRPPCWWILGCEAPQWNGRDS